MFYGRQTLLRKREVFALDVGKSPLVMHGRWRNRAI